MCEYYGLPLALIFEELVDMDKPEDKAQEQRPAEAEQERDRRKFCVIDVLRQYENLRLSQE